MTRDEVLSHLCELCTEVGSVVFKDELEHDCFCEVHPHGRFDRMHPEVIAFIRNAVHDRMKKYTP